MKKITIATIIFLLIGLNVACKSNAGTVSLSIKETSAEIVEETEETIHMNNCGGKADSSQIAKKSLSIQIEGGGKLGVDGQVVNGEIMAKYSRADGISKSLELVAPPGTNMEFVLLWTEKSWIGVVLTQDDNEQADYKVSVPLAVELVGSQDRGCPTPSASLDEDTQSNQPESQILPTTIPNNIQPSPSSSAVVHSASDPEKINTQVTQGGVSKDYSMTLKDGEILVGHADKFQNYESCVAYLIVGPGVFDFSIKSGLWDKWINVTPDLHNNLLKEQSDTLANKYSCTPVKIVKCDPKCVESEP